MSDLARQRQWLATWILRTSISLCLVLIIIGLGIFWLRGGTHLPSAPHGKLPTILSRAWHLGIGLHASAFLTAGIVVLLLTPIARLLSGVIISARVRDSLYVVIGLIVLALVLAGLLIGQATA